MLEWDEHDDDGGGGGGDGQQLSRWSYNRNWTRCISTLTQQQLPLAVTRRFVGGNTGMETIRNAAAGDGAGIGRQFHSHWETTRLLSPTPTSGMGRHRHNSFRVDGSTRELFFANSGACSPNPGVDQASDEHNTETNSNNALDRS
ncbi:unnamed protein product [Notodromas monacha]|uniref:Uncharacterized protein n=1 Tax=Notodromas monacha TaxID=399045 RepID=A0A7R9C0R2_9CRUS|nr:unnamed protein product [Notodromas monacha]CAG0923872.1 unnamed protein product [Notodromas monacha]